MELIEAQLASALRSAIDGLAIGEILPSSPTLTDALSSACHYLPLLLAEVYPYWKGESLDGFELAQGLYTSERAVSLRGLVILISDQTLAPVDLKLRIARDSDAIEWMECRLGAKGKGTGGIKRVAWPVDYAKLQLSLEQIDWAFMITFDSTE